MASQSRVRHLIGVLLVLALGAVFIKKLGDSVPSDQAKLTQIAEWEFNGALELFKSDVGRYPTTQEGLAALIQNPGVPDWHGPYLEQSGIAQPRKDAFVYRYPGRNGTYDLEPNLHAR